MIGDSGAMAVVRGLLPEGRMDGDAWVALAASRRGRRLGNYAVCLNRGLWWDFVADEGGVCFATLAAHVTGLSVDEAEIWLTGSGVVQ